MLDKKQKLEKSDNAKLGFQNNVTLFVSENLSPFNPLSASVVLI